MGYYVNVPGSKTEWLKKHGIARDRCPKFPPAPELAIVCEVDNGPFTAAAVIYSEAEADAFDDPRDPRPKTWYVLPKDKLIEGGFIPADAFQY